MHILNHTETLIYYDGIQLFLAEDQLGTKYICMLVEEGEKADKYICAPSSKSRIETLLVGDLDLRSVFKAPEIEELCIVEAASGDLTNLYTTSLMLKDLPANWLPEPSFYLDIEKPPDIKVVEDAYRRKRAIIHCSLKPPEARVESKITVEHLSQAVKLIQRLVKHAYQKSLREADTATKKEFIAPEYYELEVYAFSPGSFNVHMQSSIPADFFGYVQVSRAFEIIDSINELIDKPEQAVKEIAHFGGHFATAYRDFLNFINKTGTSVEYEWTMPKRKTSSHYKISVRQAKPLYEQIIERVDIGLEEVRLIGKLTKVDEKLETWRLVSEEDKKEYSGTSKVNLAGLIIETQRYEFICEEVLEEERGTGREITKLYLKSFHPI